MRIPLGIQIGDNLMKKKSLLLCSTLAFLSVGALAGCGQNSNRIIVWVGSESVSFYRDKAKEFLSMNPEFGYGITIIGADTGGAAGQLVSDNTACGDIVTVAHDNIGKLSQANYIVPIVDEELEAQIDADNPDSFKKAIMNILGDGSDGYRYKFGVPYISQALFLYYDNRYVTPEQAKSFEGLVEAAKQYDAKNGLTNKTKAFAVNGTDGFNNSFSLLARNITAGNKSYLRLYERGERYDSYAQDNDTVAVVKWMQRMYEDPNGAFLDITADNPWEVVIENHLALSVIGGAWHYNSFRKAVGEENMGCAVLPTFTLTDADVAGIEDVNYPMDNGYTNKTTGKVFKGLPTEEETQPGGDYEGEGYQGMLDKAPKAGDVFRGGSFVDCKCFVINYAKMTGAEKYGKMCELLRYFSSKELQDESFVRALNVPAYEGAEEFIETTKDLVAPTAYAMATAQTGMSIYGIPQPITDGTTNTFYYSKNAPDYYLNCIKKVGSGDTVESIRSVLYRMEYTWKHGSNPKEAPESYPAESSAPR